MRQHKSKAKLEKLIKLVNLFEYFLFPSALSSYLKPII